MALKVTSVSTSLDKKLLILGYEIPDLLAIFFTLAILNFLFGRTTNALALVWAPTLLLAVALRYGKRGKPDNYLLHLARYYLSPGIYHAFKETSVSMPPPKINRTGKVAL